MYRVTLEFEKYDYGNSTSLINLNFFIPLVVGCMGRRRSSIFVLVANRQPIATTRKLLHSEPGEIVCGTSFLI